MKLENMYSFIFPIYITPVQFVNLTFAVYFDISIHLGTLLFIHCNELHDYLFNKQNGLTTIMTSNMVFY